MNKSKFRQTKGIIKSSKRVGQRAYKDYSQFEVLFLQILVTYRFIIHQTSVPVCTALYSRPDKDSIVLTLSWTELKIKKGNRSERQWLLSLYSCHWAAKGAHCWCNVLVPAFTPPSPGPSTRYVYPRNPLLGRLFKMWHSQNCVRRRFAGLKSLLLVGRFCKS